MYVPRHNKLNSRAIIMVLLGAFTLSACGIKGSLKTPPPLWGAEKETKTKTKTSEDGDSILDENGLENTDDDNLFGDITEDPFEDAPN